MSIQSRIVLAVEDNPGDVALALGGDLRGDPGTKRVPAVFRTTSNEREDLLEGYEMGVNSDIPKSAAYRPFAASSEPLGLDWLTLNECLPLPDISRPS